MAKHRDDTDRDRVSKITCTCGTRSCCLKHNAHVEPHQQCILRQMEPVWTRWREKLVADPDEPMYIEPEPVPCPGCGLGLTHRVGCSVRPTYARRDVNAVDNTPPKTTKDWRHHSG